MGVGRAGVHICRVSLHVHTGGVVVSRIKRSGSSRSDDGFPYRVFVNEYAEYNEGG